MNHTQGSCGRRLRREAMLLLVASGLFVPAAAGQDQDAWEQPAPPPLKRFYFGGRLGFTGIPLVEGGSSVEATSSPAVRLTNTATRSGSRWNAGPTMLINFNRRFSINLELSPRNAGYKTELKVVSGVDLSTTTADERFTYTKTELTRADHWDASALARIYYAPRARADFRRFISFGGAYRHVSDIRTSWETTEVDASTCCDETPATPLHASIPGFVLGAGIQAVDDFGVKVTPEVRFTRWLWNAFDTPPARSSRNQWEIVIGIYF